MTRLVGILVLTLGLFFAALATVELDSDARALLGERTIAAAALDTPEGRMLTLAIVDPDRARRSALARQIAAGLESDARVARAMLAPSPPSSALLDWLWRHRLALAPPSEAAFKPARLEAELLHGRNSLAGITTSPLAARYLLDPTGSFRRLVGTLTAAADSALPLHDGVPQARDDSAALVFIEMAETAFDAAEQADFDQALAARVEAAGAEALLVGPRSVSAAISSDIQRRSALCSALASAALLVWLAIALRSAGGVLACILPAGLGAAVALLVLQAAFGSVHVLAIGFGGALMGLAIDYPLHLMAHPQGDLHVRRCIRLGAATTAVAFLSLVLAGVPALVQVGVFVAVGLSAAAGATLWMAAALPRARLQFGRALPTLRMRGKLPALMAAGLLAGGVVWTLPDKGAASIVPVPPGVLASIERLDRMVGLPSGRYRIQVAGGSLGEILDAQRRLGPVLDRARAAGLITRAEMLVDHLPSRQAAGPLLAPETLGERLAAPLASAGLRPAFADEITAAYAAALAERDILPSDLDLIASDPALASFIDAPGGALRAPVMLWGVVDPARLSAMIDESADPAVRLTDRQVDLADGIDRLSERVRLSLGVGIVAAIAFLFAAASSRRGVGEIVLGAAAAALATAAVAGLLGGGLGVFHIMALALVIGIGIDYGLVLTLSGGGEHGTAAGSVLLCATTTFIALIIMALSGVEVLEDIGTTVALGVVSMAGVSFVRNAWT